MHKLMRDELCALMIMIWWWWSQNGSSLLHQCHIISLYKKRNNHSSCRLFSFLLLSISLVEWVASWIAHNQFRIGCFVDLWIRLMLNKNVGWCIIYLLLYSNVHILLNRRETRQINCLRFAKFLISLVFFNSLKCLYTVLVKNTPFYLFCSYLYY